jgi:hypothetical protein
VIAPRLDINLGEVQTRREPPALPTARVLDG